MTSPGVAPEGNQKKGIYVHKHGGTYGSDMTEASARAIITGGDRNGMMGGIGGFLAGIANAIGGVFAAIGEAISSIFGPKKEGTLTGMAAQAYEALRPMIEQVIAAQEYMEQAVAEAEKANQETREAIQKAVQTVENMNIAASERKRLAEIVKKADTDEGKLGAALFETLRLLSLANANSIELNEEVDRNQNEVLKKLGEADRKILSVLDEQKRINRQLTEVDEEVDRTLLRFLYAEKNSSKGLSGYLETVAFNGRRVSISATGNWSGQCAVLARTNNGNIDLGAFTVSRGSGSIQLTTGAIQEFSYENVMCFVLPR